MSAVNHLQLIVRADDASKQNEDLHNRLPKQ